MLYGIHGKKRSGKDTIAKMIQEETGAVAYALADPIHRALHYALSRRGYTPGFGEYLTIEHCKGMTWWDRETNIRLQHERVVWIALDMLNKIRPFADWDKVQARCEEVFKDQWDLSFRQLMQRMGTDVVVHCEKNYWLDWVPKDQDIILSDVRQEHELEYVRKNSGNMVFVYRPENECYDSHITEMGLLPKSGDIIINNTGTLKELRAQVTTKVLK